MKKVKLLTPFIVLLFILAACADNNTNDDAANDHFNNNGQGNISSMSTNSPSEDYAQTNPPNRQGQGYGNNFRPIGTHSGEPNPPAQQRQYPPMPDRGQQDQQQPQQQQPRQQQPGQQAPGTDRPGGAAQQNHSLNQFERQVVELTNHERRNAGLNTLEIDSQLSSVAREKSRDMQAKNYFSHNSPTYGSPFDMMAQFGINYRSAAENIAAGQRSPEEVVQAWMNSEGHRENILNGGFTHIGVGFEDQGNNWTQMFIRK